MMRAAVKTLLSLSKQVHQLTPTGPRTAASRPIDHRAVHTAACRVWSTDDDRRQLLRCHALSCVLWRYVNVCGPMR